MVHPMKLRIIAAIVALSGPVSCLAAGLSGGWTVKATIAPRVKYTLLCTLSSDVEKFSGPCVGVTAQVLKATGRMDGDRMWFGYDTDYNGSGLHLDFRGVVQPGGFVRGKVDSRLSSGVFLATPLGSAQSGLSNAWKVDVAFEGLKYNVVCAFTANGAKLSGPCAVTDGSTVELSGSSDGAKVSMGYDTQYQGKALHVEYNGALTSEKAMNGTVDAGGASGIFTATKP
jgi:hypothetical protein